MRLCALMRVLAWMCKCAQVGKCVWVFVCMSYTLAYLLACECSCICVGAHWYIYEIVCVRMCWLFVCLFVCFVHTSQAQVGQWLCTFWLTLPCAQMPSNVVTVLFERLSDQVLSSSALLCLLGICVFPGPCTFAWSSRFFLVRAWWKCMRTQTAPLVLRPSRKTAAGFEPGTSISLGERATTALYPRR